MAKEIVTIMGQEVLVSHGFALGGVGLNLAMDDINGMAYSSLGLIFPNILYFQVPIPLLVSLGKGIMRSYNGML